MPPPPEFGDRRRLVGGVEVLGEMESQQQGDADGHVRVAREVAVDLQRVAVKAHQVLEAAVQHRIVEHPVHEIDADIVRYDRLFDKTGHNQKQPPAEHLPRHPQRVLSYLRNEIARTHDRTRDELRKERKIEEIHAEEPAPEILYEIELESDADDFFSVLRQEDIQFSGLGAVCSKAVRKDNGTTLLLTIELQDAGEIIGTVDAAVWAERGIGRWKKAPGASAYLVMLYRDAKRVGHPHRTSAEQYDFVPLMQTAGVYHFKVIPLTKQGKRGQAAESAWRNVTEAEAAQNREEWGGKKPGWQPEGEIPSYILKDGAYPQMDSLLIGEKYEQFNEKGENVSRTVIF